MRKPLLLLLLLLLFAPNRGLELATRATIQDHRANLQKNLGPSNRTPFRFVALRCVTSARVRIVRSHDLFARWSVHLSV